jgi:hypothetical protein
LEEQAWKTFWKLYPYNTNDRTCKQLQACPVLATLEKKKRQENQRDGLQPQGEPKIQNKETKNTKQNN